MNKLNLIGEKLPELNALDCGNTPFTFSFLINKPGDFEKIALSDLHQQKIYQNYIFSFSIYLNFSEDKNLNIKVAEEIIRNKNLLIQLFFHPGFEKKSNCPVIFLNHLSKKWKDSESLISDLNEACLNQGYNGLKVILVNPSDEVTPPLPDSDILFNYKDEISFQRFYKQIIINNFYVGHYFGLTGFSNSEIPELLKVRLETKKEIKDTSPEFYNFIEKHYELLYKNPLLEAELLELKNDLSNQKIYLDFFKNQDESKKINEFYHKEYEILPLWYKRLGHVIKVITGKRSFRSLFNNNVEKYRS